MLHPSRWRTASRGLFALAALLGALAIAPSGHADPNNAVGAQRLAVGRTPPPLALDRLSGTDEVTLQGLAGRVVVLDFWATWCGPCRAIMPVLDSLHQQHHAQGLSVVGMSPEPDARIRAHLARSPVHYTIARDVGGTMRSYGVRGIPTLVVIGRDGQVRDITVGVDGPGMRRVRQLVERLLAEPAP